MHPPIPSPYRHLNMEVIAMDESLMDFGKTIYGYLLLPSHEHYILIVKKKLCSIKYAFLKIEYSIFKNRIYVSHSVYWDRMAVTLSFAIQE